MNRKLILAFLLFCLPVAGFADSKPYTKNVAIVLYNGVEVLDFAGPAEVFQAASGFGARGEERAFNVYTVSRTKAPIVSQGFIDVVPDYSIEDSPKPDILILPGGGTGSVISDPVWMAWVVKVAGDSENVLTVCTGAFVAGRAGLLEGIEATTWYNAVPRLAEEFPKARVQAGKRFVDSGKVITTAGVSAGIDGSLHFVARTLGRYVADRTAEYMEYKWSPESYHSARYAMLNPQFDERGRTLQQASITLREGNVDGAIASYRALIAQNREDRSAWLGLGRALHQLKRYEEAITAHSEAAKGTAERPRALFNLSCEYALIGQKEKAIEAAGKAIEAGFRTKWSFENDPDLAPIREDPRFKALVARL